MAPTSRRGSRTISSSMRNPTKSWQYGVLHQYCGLCTGSWAMTVTAALLLCSHAAVGAAEASLTVQSSGNAPCQHAHRLTMVHAAAMPDWLGGAVNDEQRQPCAHAKQVPATASPSATGTPPTSLTHSSAAHPSPASQPRSNDQQLLLQTSGAGTERPDPTARSHRSHPAPPFLSQADTRMLLAAMFDSLLPVLWGEGAPGRPKLAAQTTVVLDAAQHVVDAAGLLGGMAPGAAVSDREGDQDASLLLALSASAVNSSGQALDSSTSRMRLAADLMANVSPHLDTLTAAVGSFEDAVCGLASDTSGTREGAAGAGAPPLQGASRAVQRQRHHASHAHHTRRHTQWSTGLQLKDTPAAAVAAAAGPAGEQVVVMAGRREPGTVADAIAGGPRLEQVGDNGSSAGAKWAGDHADGILREVALVRRVVVGVLHGLDLHLSSSDADAAEADSGAGSSIAGSSGLNTDDPKITRSQGGAQGGAPQQGAVGKGLQERVRAMARYLLGRLVAASRCASRAKTGGTEVLHVSKSGGSSMCELGRLAGMKNPGFNLGANCKVFSLGLLPRWLERWPPDVPELCAARSGWLRPSVPCEEWTRAENRTCADRAAELQQKHFNFALNEIGLHGSMEGHPGSAHTCPRMTTAIVMRPPVERVASHLAHIRGSLNTTVRLDCARALQAANRTAELASLNSWPSYPPTPLSLPAWAGFAPSVIDNYILRYLLGRHGMCTPVKVSPGQAPGSQQQLSSGFSAADAVQGAASLLTVDHIMVLGDAERQAQAADSGSSYADVVVRLGMGWPHTPSSVALRTAKAPHDLESHLGFPRGSSAALAALNAWDGALVGLGRRLAALDAAAWASAAMMEGQLIPTLSASGTRMAEHEFNVTMLGPAALKRTPGRLMFSPGLLLFNLEHELAARLPQA